MALIVLVLGAVGYLLFSFIERGETAQELCRLAFFAGVLAYLLGAK